MGARREEGRKWGGSKRQRRTLHDRRHLALGLSSRALWDESRKSIRPEKRTFQPRLFLVGLGDGVEGKSPRAPAAREAKTNGALWWRRATVVNTLTRWAHQLAKKKGPNPATTKKLLQLSQKRASCPSRKVFLENVRSWFFISRRR